MPNYRYDHIHLISPDPEKTAQFYQNMFNARKVNIKELSDGRIVATLDLNGTRILVNQKVKPEASSDSLQAEGGELHHFGLITDNLEAAVADLKAKGAQFRVEIKKGSEGEFAFLLAPDNVLIELVESKSP